MWQELKDLIKYGPFGDSPEVWEMNGKWAGLFDRLLYVCLTLAVCGLYFVGSIGGFR
jgi:hypothetical protein